MAHLSATSRRGLLRILNIYSDAAGDADSNGIKFDLLLMHSDEGILGTLTAAFTENSKILDNSGSHCIRWRATKMCTKLEHFGHNRCSFSRATALSSSSFFETLAKNISQFNTTGSTEFWCTSGLLALAVAHDNLLTIDSSWSHSMQFFTGYNLCIMNGLHFIGQILTVGRVTVLSAPVLFWW